MAVRARLWEVTTAGDLQHIPSAMLDLEQRLEAWIERDVSIISSDLLVIGRQVPTSLGGLIDLLCLGRDGDLTVVELKRDKTPREITAQVLDYAAWVKDLSRDHIVDLADRYLRDRGTLEQVFLQHFGTELPETLNQRHRMLIVGSQIDASSERIITYLSDTYGVAINAVTFQFFRTTDCRELLARVFLLEPSAVEERASTLAPSKRRQNLSREELQEIAITNGVGELYERLVKGLERRFDQVRTTRSSLAFIGRIGSSENAIFSLIPGESNHQDGVRFQVYLPRLMAYIGFSEADAVAVLPVHREPWAYYPSAPPDMTGYAGFFAEDREVERFVSGLAQS